MGGHKNWRERRKSRMAGGAKPSASTSSSAEFEYEYETPAPPVFTPQAVLVAGHNWHNPKQTMVTYCYNRAARLLRKDKSYRFTIFDFTSGQILSGRLEKGKLKWNLVGQRKAISPSHYTISGEKYTFKGDPDVMSITDVYKKIILVGAMEPGTLKELYFAGHGWLGGPALVNSYDGVTTSLKRNPADKDPRGQKDFAPVNMSRTQLTRFRRAFAADGFAWVAGCSFPRPVYQLLYRMLRSKTYQSLYPNPIPDNTEFTFTFTSAEADKWYPQFKKIFPGGSAGSYPTTFKRTWRQMRIFLAGILDQTYARRFTRAIGKPCRSAFPGTYADYQHKSIPLRIQVIPRDRKLYGINFQQYIDFYKTYFNMKEDPEGLGYGVFEP